MFKYGPRYFAGYKFQATCKTLERQRAREMTEQTKYIFQRTTTLHPGLIKQTKIIIVAEETVFMQTLAVLSPTPIIFGIKHFDTEVRDFMSSCPELKLTYKC